MMRSVPTVVELENILLNEENCIEFLFINGILTEKDTCEECGGNMSRYGRMFQCSKKSCRKSCSIFAETFFSGVRINCNEVLHLGVHMANGLFIRHNAKTHRAF
jgi:hypothetical protein